MEQKIWLVDVRFRGGSELLLVRALTEEEATGKARLYQDKIRETSYSYIHATPVDFEEDIYYLFDRE